MSSDGEYFNLCYLLFFILVFMIRVFQAINAPNPVTPLREDNPLRMYDILLKRFIEVNNGYEQYKQKIEARYEFLYKYLSNFVHVSPFSLDQPHHDISIDEFKKIFQATIITSSF